MFHIFRFFYYLKRITCSSVKRCCVYTFYYRFKFDAFSLIFFLFQFFILISVSVCAKKLSRLNRTGIVFYFKCYRIFLLRIKAFDFLKFLIKNIFLILLIFHFLSLYTKEFGSSIWLKHFF